MKKILICLALIAVMIPKDSFSQRRLGQTVITANAGISPMAIISSMGANANVSNDVFRSTPVYIAHMDIGITKVISIGPSMSYQSFRYYYDQSTNYGVIRSRDITTRANYGGRLLFHFGKKERENFDVYAGVRVGCSVWNLSTTNPSSSYLIDDYERNQPWGIRVPLKARDEYRFSVQALYGFRYYFSKFLGINFEFSIGSPVLFSVGLNAKLF
jgi:hypothetical protein